MGVPEANFDLKTSLTKRLKYVTEVVEEVDGPGIPGPIAGQEVEEDSSGNPGGLGAGEERFHEWGEEIQDFNI
jgi:hypothetical protein